MAKTKFYAIKIGKKPGIYKTWVQAEEQVKGFPGAVFKAFSTEADAIKFISNDIEQENKETENIDIFNKKIDNEIKILDNKSVIAFVDGSYKKSINNNKEKYSFGVVLITAKTEEYLYRAYVAPDFMSSRNVAGELEGVKQAIFWSIQNNMKNIKIFYDYEGIKRWATKEWKAKKELTKQYSRFIDEKSKVINIEFVHAKAHSGIKYNEKADQLAKYALLAKGYKTYKDGSVYIVAFDKNEWLLMLEEFTNINGLNDECNVEVNKVEEYLDRIIITCKTDQVTINCYRGSKSYVQGKQTVLFEEIITSAIERLPSNAKVIEVLNRHHVLNITEEECENEFSQLLPNFPINFQDVKHRNTILSAVYNTMIVGYMPDYTCLVTPCFRILEFYLHRILGYKLKKITDINGKNNFAFFRLNKSTNKYECNIRSLSNSLNNEQIEFLNKLYNIYHDIRHPYSHWNRESIDTQVISTLEIATEKIRDILKYVDKYYEIY